MAVLGHGDIVFNPDADALPALFDLWLALGDRQPVTDIEARLNGQDHPGLEAHMVFTQAIGADVMDIEAQPMAGAMHVEVAVGPLLDDPVHLTAEQAKVHQALDENPNGGVMDRFSGLPGSHNSHRGFLSGQHHLVEGALLRAEATVDREGARDVSVVVVVQGATGVDQKQIAVVQHRVIRRVMQNTGVIPAGNNRAIGRTSRPLLKEVLLDHPLHLALIQPGARHLTGQFMGFRGNARRFAHAADLLGALAQPQGMQQRAGRHQAQGRRTTTRRPIELAGPGLQDMGFNLGVLADPEGNALGTTQVIREPFSQLLTGMGQVSAKALYGAFTAPTEPHPDLGAGFLGLDEEDEPFPLGPVRQKEGNGVGLIEARQIPEVTVLAKRPLAVGVVGHQRSGGNHRGGTTEGLKETSTALGKDVRSERHGSERC